MPKALHIVESTDFVGVAAHVLLGELLGALEDAELRRRVVTTPSVAVCLAGGSTPRPVYEALVATAPPRFPWGRLDLWLGDERWVDAHDPESNERMVRETILGPTGMDTRSLRGVDTSCESPETAATLYEAELPAHGEFDLMVLGVGTDCHTASIFPGSPATAERERQVVASVAPVEPAHRVTITLPVIARARRLVTLARGRQKARAVAAAIEGSVSSDECPARAARDGIWVLDTAAASGLRGA